MQRWNKSNVRKKVRKLILRKESCKSDLRSLNILAWKTIPLKYKDHSNLFLFIVTYYLALYLHPWVHWLLLLGKTFLKNMLRGWLKPKKHLLQRLHVRLLIVLDFKLQTNYGYILVLEECHAVLYLFLSIDFLVKRDTQFMSISEPIRN